MKQQIIAEILQRCKGRFSTIVQESLTNKLYDLSVINKTDKLLILKKESLSCLILLAQRSIINNVIIMF